MTLIPLGSYTIFYLMLTEVLSQSNFIPTVTGKYCNKSNSSDFIELISINVQHDLHLYLLL